MGRYHIVPVADAGSGMFSTADFDKALIMATEAGPGYEITDIETGRGVPLDEHDFDEAKERLNVDHIAQAFHDAYEQLAPGFSYKTREASAVPWDDVPAPNKSLMRATVVKLLNDGVIQRPMFEREDGSYVPTIRKTWADGAS